MRLCLVASKPTDAVTHGFLPAAARLGLDVVVLTDRPGSYPGHVVACDVWDFRALISCISGTGGIGSRPDAVFSNSDHLQAQTALAAAYFGLPGKNWQASLRAKNKPLMRRRLAETGTEQVAAVEITAGSAHPVPGVRYPAVVKPAEGVASEDVVLVHDADELARCCAEIFARRAPAEGPPSERQGGERLVAEEYLPGTLRTLETIGDGHTTWVLGGFRTQLSPPPYFIEERLTWDPPTAADRAHVLRALADVGESFGACHTEFVSGPAGPRLIEINDRLIGDHGEFLLADLTGLDLFELILRVHLGERLPAPEPPITRRHGVASYISAERSGLLAAAPAPGPVAGAEPGVQLSYWPYCAVGSRITVANSNRDYLGVLTAFGPSADAVDRSVAAAHARGGWEISA